ncbi:MAG: YjbH domain-containing protein [Alphaproteobacteria bacterium]
MYILRLFFLVLFIALKNTTPAQATGNHEQNGKRYTHTPAISGFLGLNTTPSARMDTPGTLRAGTSTLDPYLHTTISAQIAEPLALTLRQTAEISSMTKDAKSLHPGVDIKLRLLKENTYRPQVALGIQSALGHKRMAAEYIALSKRYKNIDLTAGLGWGRFGSAGHFKNPLASLSPHFEKDRNDNQETPNKPSNWFTGEDIGLFGGLEVFLPYDGLSLKFDYGADRYIAEKAQSGYHNTSPWAAGLSYSYKDWISAGIALQGTDKLMGRLSISGMPEKWPLRPHRYKEATPLKQRKPAQSTDINRIINEANQDNIKLSNIWTDPEKTHIHATLHLPEDASAPKHAGRAARHIINNAADTIKIISLILETNGLHGTRINLIRPDIEKALQNPQTSTNELWQSATFDQFVPIIQPPQTKEPQNLKTKKTKPFTSVFLPEKHTNTDLLRPIFIKSEISSPLSNQEKKGKSKQTQLRLFFDNQIGLSEEDSGLLHRSSFIIEARKSPFLGFLNGASLRLNLHDNLDNIAKLRPPAVTPVRSDIDAFTDTFISLENMHASYAFSPAPAFYTAASAGYFEEAYAGFGAQILYRPVYSRFALGAELWQAFRRNPDTLLNLALNGQQVTTGHAHLWYDIPRHNVTAKLSAGHYLIGDLGITAGLEKSFKNGASLRASTTLTNTADPDLFGDATHANHNLALTLPLGSLPYVPSGSAMRITSAPFGRDAGQTLNKPFDLYDLTQSFSIDNIARHWHSITE